MPSFFLFKIYIYFIYRERFIYISKICASESQVPHRTEAGLAMQLKAQEEDSQSSTNSEPLKKTPEGPGVFLQRASWCKGGQ